MNKQPFTSASHSVMGVDNTETNAPSSAQFLTAAGAAWERARGLCHQLVSRYRGRMDRGKARRGRGFRRSGTRRDSGGGARGRGPGEGPGGGTQGAGPGGGGAICPCTQKFKSSHSMPGGESGYRRPLLLCVVTEVLVVLGT